VLTAETPGQYVVSAAISADGGQTLVGQPGSYALQVEAPRPTPTDTPTPTPIVSDAVIRGSEVNLRAGPGTAYDLVDKLTKGVELTVIGRTEDGKWFEVKPKDGTPGWVTADLIDLNHDADEFPVSQNIPPTPTPRPTNTPGPTRTPQPTAVAQAQPTPGPQPQQQLPAAPPPRAVGTVGYGIQADMLTDGNHARILDHVKGMGFNWIKQQVEWFRVEPNKGQYDWGGLDRIVDSANAYGINILFSVVKAPRWARPGNTDFSVEGPPANPQDFADFLTAMAGRYKGRVRAYEVWNEQNLWYEWGHEPLDAGRYVQLLAVAYRGIKAGDPGAIVVSGALTPTGVNDGVIGVDDALYLEQMYRAGLKNYCDAVGVHPSGYNNPATVFAETWSDASAQSFKGHRSFFFRSTMRRYREIMNAYGDGAKRLWATEFGWASVENMGAGPAAGYGYAADNTEGEQAQFLVDAFQIARQYGVGVMFIWNLNFAPITGPGDEKAAFSNVRCDWSLRPAYTALRDMPK
jgi:hypothetical protein